MSSTQPASTLVESVVFGHAKTSEKLAQNVQTLKDNVTDLDRALKGKNFLVGDQLTFADIFVFCSLIPAYQLVIDPEFRGSTTNATKWFEHLASLPEVRKRVGAVKPC